MGDADGVKVSAKRNDRGASIDDREPTCVNKGNLHVRKRRAREANADRSFDM